MNSESTSFNFIFLTIQFILILVGSTTAHAQVEPPNYNFSIEKFQNFMPGKKLADIEKDFGKGEKMFKKDPYITYRFYITHLRYKFAILVQAKDGEIVDFHARLPTYFLHDIFHQSLINRLGKQNIYFRENEQAIYVWNQQSDDLVHTYSGACSITCFPVFYAVEKKKATASNPGEYQSILEQLTKQLPSH